MPIYAKQSGTWYQGNSTPANLIYAKQGGTWYTAAYVYARQNGTWYNAGYVGKTNPPTNLRVVSAADDFGTVVLYFDGPNGGAPPSYYVVKRFNSSGGYIDQTGNLTSTQDWNNCRFSVNQDTQYIFRAYSYNAAGESAPSADLRWQIGHTQLTHQDPVYGWGGEFDWGGSVVDWSTNMAGHEPGYAVDWADNPSGCMSTTWLSGGRSLPSKAECIRISPRGGLDGNSRCSNIRLWLTYGRRLWVSWLKLSEMQWYGTSNYLTDRNLWFDTAAMNKFTHWYNPSDVGVPSNTEYDMNPLNWGWDFRANDMQIDCAVDQLDNVGGTYRGGFVEIIFRFQTWQVVSYNTVIDRNQQNNGGW